MAAPRRRVASSRRGSPPRPPPPPRRAPRGTGATRRAPADVEGRGVKRERCEEGARLRATNDSRCRRFELVFEKWVGSHLWPPIARLKEVHEREILVAQHAVAYQYDALPTQTALEGRCARPLELAAAHGPLDGAVLGSDLPAAGPDCAVEVRRARRTQVRLGHGGCGDWKRAGAGVRRLVRGAAVVAIVRVGKALGALSPLARSQLCR